MSKIEREKAVVSRMIRIYCRHKEENKTLCASCQALEAYAHQRLDKCKYGEKKTSCRQCPTHCYAPSRRELIRKVMRYVGPRMLFYTPVEALRHWLQK